MQLSILLNDFFSLPLIADRDIADLTLDSRQVKSNGLFLAVKGAEVDGCLYIDKAIALGAVAVLIEVDQQTDVIQWKNNIPLIPVRQLKQKIGLIAARFYDFPAKKLRMIGVTGTNGKTSCTHFIAQLLQNLHIPCGMIGTLGNGFYGALTMTGLTTPDPVTLQATLAEFVNQGAKAVAMEVSSHSIDQGRVNGIDFEIGVFTNLTQDHLDYHGDMQTYAAVKRHFLAAMPTQHLIINRDDDYGHTWISELATQKPVYAYSTQHQGAFTYADHIDLSLQGIKARIHSPWGEGNLTVPLIGQFNLSNVLAVLATLCVYGIPFETVLLALSKLSAVPGRMQTLGGHHQPLAVVDYAHTPDALEKVLQALRAHTKGQLICVFGCGGDRDPLKRPIMAKMAEQWADRVIVTNDNPRHEKPDAILEQIMQGFSHPERVFVELDRAKAIQKSIQWSSTDDCILIAGKGAEHYQQIGDEKLPFDDVSEVRSHLN
jgi:UDP-N-acetylmuramoyl-L-alanyl-D-glutamate--2,6-diaminopimelate ligase